MRISPACQLTNRIGCRSDIPITMINITLGRKHDHQPRMASVHRRPVDNGLCICAAVTQRPPYRARPASPGRPDTNGLSVAAGGSRRGRLVGRRGAERAGRRAQRASLSFSSRLSERSARRARSELRDAPCPRAPQGSRRVQRPTAPPGARAGSRLPRRASKPWPWPWP